MRKALAIILAATLLGFIASPVWSAGTLKVTTPNVGQKWTTGKKYTLKWRKGNAGASVKIQLLKNGKHYRWISKKTKNDGKHRWKIPSTIKTGSAYKIKITSIKNKKVFDSSNKQITITKTKTKKSGGGVASSLTSGSGWRFDRSMPIGAKRYGYRVVSSSDHPVRFGKRSERFLVKPGDCSRNRDRDWDDCMKDRERSELIQGGDSNRQYEGDEYWYRWSIYIPEGHRNIYETILSYGQFHQIDQKGCPAFGPPFMFQEFGGGYWLNIRNPIKGYDDNRQLLEAREFVGKWNDIVVNARWTKKSNGRFRVWVNGEEKTSYYGKTMTCKEVYFKYGVYRSYISRSSKSKTVTTTAYFDGVVRSKTKKGMFDPLSE